MSKRLRFLFFLLVSRELIPPCPKDNELEDSSSLRFVADPDETILEFTGLSDNEDSYEKADLSPAFMIPTNILPRAVLPPSRVGNHLSGTFLFY